MRACTLQKPRPGWLQDPALCALADVSPADEQLRQGAEAASQGGAQEAPAGDHATPQPPLTDVELHSGLRFSLFLVNSATANHEMQLGGGKLEIGIGSKTLSPCTRLLLAFSEEHFSASQGID